MKLKEYLKEKKEHRNSESFFCHKPHFGFYAISILGITFIIVYLFSDFNFSFPEIFFLIILAWLWIYAFYSLIFECPAFLYTTDSQLVVWDNFFKKRSIEKKQIKKAYVFDDRHPSSTKLKNILRLELNDGNFFDVCLDSGKREKNETTAMVIISALRCPYESEYEQKTITKLDDEEKAKLDDEEKEILKKAKKQRNLIYILAFVYYGILFCFQWKYQFFDEEMMDYAIYAPLFVYLIYVFVKNY